MLEILSEKQVKFWCDQGKDDPIELLTLLVNKQIKASTVREEIFNNPDWDPTEE
tara:strand:- start:135 stop:296 length:162 start_codon:yes stop_codon:yes gene_type:complete